MPVDLIVLAAVAVFILLRLYGVLGQNIGHDEPPMTRDATFDGDNKVIELTPQQLENAIQEAVADEEPEDELDGGIQDGVRKIRTEDRSFRMKPFLEGAKVAFEMVMESFSADDRETLKSLMSKQVYEVFHKELQARQDADEYTDTTLISILEAEPAAIEVHNRKASITVRFVTEQIQVNRTKDGETVKDSTSAIEQVEDEWVFTRDLRSNNPNWQIVAT